MKNITRKLLVSILAVAFAVIALGTSTYAWFTLGGTVSTGQFSSKMVASEGMEISIDDETWYSTMAADVINDKITADYAALAFTDVTTADGLAFKTVDGTTDATANTDYLSLPIYIKTTKASATVYLSTVDFSATQAITWTADADATDDTYTIEAGSDYSFNAANAVRLSIITDPAGTPAVAGVYDPADIGNAYGEAKRVDGFAQAYADAKGFDLTSNTIDPVAASTSLVSAPISFTTAATTTLPADGGDGWYHTTITLNIWLDGWDGDCINAIMGSTLISTIGFSLTAPTV